MKDNNYIDDLFRSGLEDFEMNPSEKNWNSLETELAKKLASRKRKNRIKLFSIALLLLLTSFITYKFYTTNNSSTSENKKETVSADDIRNNKASSSNIKSTDSSPVIEIESQTKASGDPSTVHQNKANGDQSTVHQTEIKSSVQQIQKHSEEASVVEINKSAKTFSNRKSGENKKAETEENNITNSVKSKNSIHTNKSIVKRDQTLAGVATISSVPNSLVSQQKNNSTNSIIENNNPSKESDNKISLTDNEQKTVDVSNRNGKAPVQNEIIAENSSPNKDNKPIEPGENLKSENPSPSIEPEKKDLKNEISLSVDSGKSASSVNTDYVHEQKSDSSTSLLKKIVSHLSAEIFYSPDYVSNKIKVNDSYTGTASQNLSDYNNQKAAFSYSTGMNVRYDLGSKWSIGSGISYSTFAQTAVYNTINVVSDSVYQFEHGHRGVPHGGRHGGFHGGIHGGQNPHRPPGNGNHHYVIQTPCGAIDLYHEPPHHNGGNHRNGDTINIKTETSESLQFINIPLTVRYQFGHNKLSYFVEGGAAISFVKGDKVKITIDDAYIENNERDGLRNINYSLLFGAGVQYNFYKGLSMFLKPSFRYSITPVNQDNPMYSYPYYFGIEVGVSIHF